ncbi:MAG TPA: 3-phosphoshikimate 1-carboxyvinyltransferase [Flavipsychrobacter sp.]|nr:3-phosphoshikimate 1-carboxyvinyltransferase [Flavipsychrobacter sp.]
MQAIIKPGKIQGTIQAPASKSMMQRACAGALLHDGETIIHHPGNSRDDIAAISIIQQLGAKITNQTEDILEISSNGINPVADSINCGESGLSARLFSAIAALSNKSIQIRGEGSLLKRPMVGFDKVFSQLGVQLPDFNGQIPFTIKGPLHPQSISLDASLSSQFLSGLLFALSYAAKEPLTINVSNLKSKPYVDLTLDVLNHFDRPIVNDNYQRFLIDPAQFEKKQKIEIEIEGDWSGAANWLVAGCIAGTPVTITGLNLESKQADKRILDLLQIAGAIPDIKNDRITIEKTSLQEFEFDATDCPDLFPILSILAACTEGESYIHGLHRLFHKESNRAESIGEMLQQFEVPYSIEDDSLCITGTETFPAATIDSYNDHRIVMAASIGALRTKGTVIINEAEAVDKSYPDFFRHFVSARAECILNKD